MLWLFVRCAQSGVHVLEVLLQRVVLVKLNQLLTQDKEEEEEEGVEEREKYVRQMSDVVRGEVMRLLSNPQLKGQFQYLFWSMSSYLGRIRLSNLRLNP